MENTGKHTAIVLAAGQGKRMGTKVAKQYLLLEDKPVLYYSLKAFEDCPFIGRIILVVGNEEQAEYCKEEFLIKYQIRKITAIVTGGKERYHSVFEGLKAAERNNAEGAASCLGRAECDAEISSNANDKKRLVFIHDGARPFLTEDILERTRAAALENEACVAGMPVKDTIKLADESGFVASTLPRHLLWTIQTPQVFEFSLIYKAYADMLLQEEELLSKGIKITDDAMVLETVTTRKVKLVEGSYENIKITTPEDLQSAAAFLKK